MFGLAYLIFFALYLLVSLIAVIFAVVWAGRYKRSRLLWGGLAALLMYNLVFWDWLPTVVMHNYYCEKEAGVWVYKTPDQWKAENPGVMEILVENNRSPEGISPDWPMERRHDMNIAHINQRFGMVYKDYLSSPNENVLFLNVWRWEYELLDKDNGEILVRRVDFSSGRNAELKFWLKSESCLFSNEQARKFYEFIKQVKGTRK